jgi:hypothetical protein
VLSSAADVDMEPLLLADGFLAAHHDALLNRRRNAGVHSFALAFSAGRHRLAGGTFTAVSLE